MYALTKSKGFLQAGSVNHHYSKNSIKSKYGYCYEHG